MSRKHPIISVTGSSGAGTTTVKHTFDQIFRREGIKAVSIEGDAFHRFDRAAMKAELDARLKAGDATFSHFSYEANILEDLERVFREYGETGTGRTRHYVHDDREAEQLRLGRPAPSPTGRPSRTTATCSSTRACTARWPNGHVNLSELADLKIGVVPVVNLEWTQKIHRDRAQPRLHHRGGDRRDPAADARLRALHLPAVHRDRHQLPAGAGGRHLEPVHRAVDPDGRREPRRHPLPLAASGIDFPYLVSMIHGSWMSRANSIVIPGNKLDLAMQLILTPLILRLVDNAKRA